MKRLYRRHENYTRGSALAMVLIFMTIFLLLGTALLLASQSGVQQSVAVLKTDTHYYSAEAAAQLASQLFIQEFSSIDIKKEKSNIPNNMSTLQSEIAQMREDLRSSIQDELQGAYSKAADVINLMSFNGEDATLQPMNFENLIILDDSHLTGTVGSETYKAIVYLETSSFPISTTSAGRTVTVDAVCNTALTTGIVNLPPVNYASANGGAFFNQNNTLIYAGDSPSNKNTIYTNAIIGLTSLIGQANSIKMYDIIPETLPVGESWKDTFADGNKYVHVTSANITASTKYADVIYLWVDNSLTISETVDFPNLKGVFVGGAMTVNENAKINSGISNSNNKPLTEFLIKGRLTITATATVDWGRFFVQGASIEIHSKGNSGIDSNSIFIATDDGSGKEGMIVCYKDIPAYATGRTPPFIGGSNNYRMNKGGDNRAPQFYAEGRFDLWFQNGNSEVLGIYMTLSNEPMFRGSVPDANKLQGVFVGNCSLQNNNTMNTTVNALSGNQINDLMDGGLFTLIQDGSGSMPGSTQVSHVVTSNLGLARLRETTP